MVIDDPKDVWVVVVNMKRVTLERNYVLVLSDHDGDADIDVRQETKILVVDETRGFADVPIAVEFHGRRNGIHGSKPGPAGYCVPGNFDSLTGLKAANIRLIDEGTHNDVGEIGLLQEQIARLYECTRLYKNGIDNPVKRCSDARFAERIFGARICGLSLQGLCLGAGNFWSRIALLLFLLEQVQISLCVPQGRLCLADFSGRGRPILLKALERVEIVLGYVSRAAGFDQLRIQGDDFFLGTAVFCCGKTGLCGLDLRLGFGSLRANIVVIELQQKLPLLDVIALFDEQALDDSGDRGMSLEANILDGFDFAVGGNDASNGAALYRYGVNFDWRLMQVRIQDEDQNDACGNNPNPAARQRRIRIVRQSQPIIFQSEAGISVSSNLPFERQAEHTAAFRYGCELDARSRRSGAVSVPLQ